MINAQSCFECELPADVMHHVIPVLHGGKRTLPLCEGCHNKVHDKSGDKIRTSLSSLITSALKKKKNNKEYLGRPRFGFEMNPGTHVLVPNDREQGIIGRICELRALDISYREVHLTLKEEGMVGRNGRVPGIGTIHRIVQYPDLFSRTAACTNPAVGELYKKRSRN